MKTASTTGASWPRPGTRNGVLVEPGWPQAHPPDPRVRVVDVDVSPAAYDDWHIDGAVLWNIYADLKDAGYRLADTAPGTTLVHVRSAAECRGERFWPWGGMQPDGRAGHVPSAVHQPIDGIYHEDGSFRSAAELRDVFAQAVLEDSRELITCCNIGGRAATAWFVLTHLIGRDRVRVYDGSWAERAAPPAHMSRAREASAGR